MEDAFIANPIYPQVSDASAALAAAMVMPAHAMLMPAQRHSRNVLPAQLSWPQSMPQVFLHHPRPLAATSALRPAAKRPGYDAFGDIGTAFRELEWKTPIFSGRVARRTPSAS
jgi:hypothetical protein